MLRVLLVRAYGMTPLLGATASGNAE